MNFRLEIPNPKARKKVAAKSIKNSLRFEAISYAVEDVIDVTDRMADDIVHYVRKSVNCGHNQQWNRLNCP
jgi:hypothetical protein